MKKFHKILNKKCDVKISKKTIIQENVVLGSKCKEISIGYGCYIGRDVFIDVEKLAIGDYTTIHHGSIISGTNTMIGHNCWFGHYTIIDSLGGETIIGNNVGVGAHSQLWSHIKFGDTLAGCKWNSSKKLILEDDVWLVGHSITGPITAKKKSMLMTGGVALKDMEENNIYAGSPAINITHKLGTQFKERKKEEVEEDFNKLLYSFTKETGISTSSIVAVAKIDPEENNKTQFIPYERIYCPTRSEVEYEFIKYCLYDKAKFLPIHDVHHDTF